MIGWVGLDGLLVQIDNIIVDYLGVVYVFEIFVVFVNVKILFSVEVCYVVMVRVGKGIGCGNL